MKKYILLKDLPFVEAGEKLEIYHSDDKEYLYMFDSNGDEIYQFKIGNNVAEMHNEWFEEIQEYFFIDSKGDIEYARYDWNDEVVEARKLIGNYFETYKEAKKYLEYLKAKVVIKQDTKGFKPNWNDKDEIKYWGYWDFYHNKPDNDYDYGAKRVEIFFRTKEDLKESFEKHPEEWRTYLTYEQ